MSKTFGVLAFVCVAALAVGAAWWALRGEPGSAPTGGSSATATAGAADGDPDLPDAGSRAGRAGAGRATGPEADALALGGTVSGGDGKPLAGALVECFRVEDDEPEDDVRRTRGILAHLVDDPAEFESIAQQIGGRVEGTGVGQSPRQTQRAMRTGQRMFGRIATDPAVLGRIMNLGSELTAGMEDDARLAPLGTVTTGADGAFRFDGLRKGRAELRVTAPRFQRRKMRAAVGRTDLKVELAPAGTVAGIVLCEGEPVSGAEVRFRTRAVRTGADGRFRFDGGRPPREPVIASAPGCVTRGVWANVEPGKDGEEIVLTLDPGGRVEGRVTTRDGAPVAGATIAFAPDMGGLMRMFAPAMNADVLPVPLPSATTIADGTYVMEGVPARSVRLRADAPGLLGANAPEARVPPRGLVQNVDFVLVRESVIEGRVLDASGTPVEDASVRVEVPGEGMMAMAAQFMGGIAREASTAADGSYRVGGLPEGSRNVTVEADGWLRAKETVQLPAEATERRDFTLSPGLRLTGRVAKPDGTPAAGATVRVTSRSGDRPAMAILQMLGGEGESVATGIDGTFEAKGLQEGPWDVVANMPGFLEGSANEVQPGSEAVITLGAAATIRGKVTATDGTPVAGASVTRRGKSGRRGSGNPFLDQLQREPSVETSADGTFEISGLVAGPYELRARGRGYADSEAVKIEAAAGAVQEGVTLVLPPGSAVSGRVLRKSDGSPVDGAVVWVSANPQPFAMANAAEILGGTPKAPDDSVSATTGPDGGFVLEGLTPGKVTLEVRGSGFAPRTVAGAEVPSSSVVVEMSQGGTLAGVVFDKSGVPTEGASVILQQGMMGTGFTRTATSGRDGTYRIERIPPGTYSALMLDPESPMGMGGMSSVAIRDGETTKKDFGKRAAGGPVDGSVMADGAPVANATVMLMGGPAGFVIAQADAQGKFHFDHVEAGEYSVMVQTAASIGGGTPAGRLTVGADGKAPPLAIQMSTLAIEGTVTDAETSKAITFAQVTLLDAGSSGATLADTIARQKGQAFTDANGRFRILNVPAGTFSLRVTASGFAESEIRNVAGGGAALKVRMTRGVEFAVTVLGAVPTPSGFQERPVAGATIVPAGASGEEGLAFDITMTKTTGPDGVARLRLQPGAYTLHVRATGFPAASVNVDAAAGAVTVHLEAGGVVDVIVRAGGAPVAGASVKILDASGTAIDEALTMTNFLGAGGTTDGDGRARREGLRAGRVTVVVKTPAGKELRSEVTVVAGQTANVELVAD